MPLSDSLSAHDRLEKSIVLDAELTALVARVKKKLCCCPPEDFPRLYARYQGWLRSGEKILD